MVHEAAREQAITIAILEFIPMEQHDAVTQRMEDDGTDACESDCKANTEAVEP